MFSFGTHHDATSGSTRATVMRGTDEEGVVSRTLGFGLALVLAATGCGGGGTSVDDIKAGDCFDDPGTTFISELELIECGNPHDNEVFSEVFLSETVFPGEDTVAEFAFDACFDQFEAYVGESYLDSPLDYFYMGPTQESWDSGDRGVLCVLYAADLTKLNGSAAGG